MPKYKVGDVAALFPKPSAPKSDTGKKIQSLFDDFYKNSNKVNKPNKAQFQQKRKQTNNAETYSDTPNEGKKKKRKFRDIEDTELNAQNTIKSQKKQKKAKLDSTNQNSNGKTSQDEEKYFPRNRKKSKQFNENSSAFSEMHFDDDEEKSFSHFDSGVQKVGDKKKKKNKLSMSEIFENHDGKKFKNKSSKKMRVFINSRNQSEEFDVTDTSVNNTLEEKQSPEKKSKKKKNKKQKKDKIVQNKAVAQEVLSDTENTEVQNDDEKPKIKQKSKKVKKSFPLENSLNEKSKTDEDLEDKDESSKASLGKKKLQKKPEETAERLSRTLFVGNLPVKMTRHGLQKLFSPFGAIETCRLRGSVPVKATIPKKVAAIKNQFHAGQKSCIGYVVFKDAKHATEALTLNGDLVGDHHIVVNPASSSGEKKTYDENRSIFIGNLPFDVEDEAIWSAFAACGEVEAVRAIRDPETGAGKGFGYVLFKNIESKEAALKMEGVEIANRKIRIKEVKSNVRKPVNKFNAMKRKAWKLKSKKDGPNSRKSLKKLMNREKLNYQKKKIANIFKKFSA